MRGTLNISITTLVDDVGVCSVGLNEVMEQIAARINCGWRGGTLEVGIDGCSESLQRVYWDYEGPGTGAERTHGTRISLLC